VKTLLVVNPHSANCSTGRDWPKIREGIIQNIGEFDEAFTQAPDDATQIVRAALQSGTERIICVGGDGTSNEIVNGFFSNGQPINPDACLGLVPRGTGGDLRKTFGLGKKPGEYLPVLAAGKTQKVDVGHTRFVNAEGQAQERMFINITSFGIGGLVDLLVNRTTKALGGKASFFMGTARAIIRYRNQTIRLKVDDHFDEEIRINNVAVANGQYHGGGMWVAPMAEIDDGLFDVVIFGDLSKWEFITKGTRVYKGTHLDLAKVRALRGKRIEATSDEEVLIDMDGEQPGRLPITLEVMPKAIKLIVP